MTITRCLCQSFEFGQFAPELDADYNTNCSQTTTRIFAQGHDAKLVGFLVRAELAGEEIRRNNGGVVHSFGSAVSAAASISDALALKAQAQLDAARARVAKKAAREATKTARKSAKAAQPQPQPMFRDAKIKVGRWTYDAKIATETGSATYRTKLGQDKMALMGEYKEV